MSTIVEELDQELKQATLRVARRALSEFGTADLYGFSLLATSGFEWITSTIFTESGLRSVTQQYFDKHESFRKSNPTFERGMDELRWSPGDSPHWYFAHEEFADSKEILNRLWQPVLAHPDPYGDVDSPFERAYRVIEVCALRALAQLRSSSILPDPIVRCLMMGDQSDEQRLVYAEVLNSPTTLARFRKELDDLRSLDEATLHELRRHRPPHQKLLVLDV